MTAHPRYPAPAADKSFSEEAKFRRWHNLTRAYARTAIEADATIDEPERDRLLLNLAQTQPPEPLAIVTREGNTGHDVVAYLSLVEEKWPDLAPYFHYGLTSSDLVENAHFAAIREHTYLLTAKVVQLQESLTQWEAMPTVRAGRTHGQVADLTSWNHQMFVMVGVLRRIIEDLRRYYARAIVKSMGPTGRTPLGGGRDQILAESMSGQVVMSTQVIPRDHQLEWAAIYLRLAGATENLALLVRLGSRSEVAEVQEGAERVGSSAMPHKHNPIASEKVCGLARVARGHFATLAEGVALWEDRDLTNSSMERIAVPGLAATVEHMVLTMTNVMSNLVVDFERMRLTAERTETASNILQVLAQKHFKIGPVAASQLVKRHVQFRHRDLYVDGHKILIYANTDQPTIQEWAAEAVRVWKGVLGIAEEE